MKTETVRVFLLVIFINIFTINYTFAIKIKNINYGASNNNDRWVEIYNDGLDISDFTSSDFKLLDSKDVTKHGINILQGDATFPAGSTIFISPSLNIPTDATKVFRSSYSLDKTNGYVSIINSDNSGSYDCLNYGSIICPNTPKINSSTNNNTDNTNSTTTNSNNSTTTSTSTNEIVNNGVTNTVYIYLPSNNQNKYGDINVLLPNEKVVPAGADSDYTVKVTDSQKKILTGLDFNWSFGDGGEKFGKDVTYHYIYPGEYTLIATADGYTVSGEAKMKVSVISPDVSILKVGTNKDENFIDLKNNTNYDLFLSNFYVFVDGEYYKLPKKFIIEKGKVVHISGEALGFHLPASNVSLYYPNKNLLTSYKNLISTLNLLEINNKQTEKSNSISISNINSTSTNFISKNIEVNNNFNKSLYENNKKNIIKSKKEINIENILYIKPLLLESKDIKEINKDFKDNVKNNNTVDTELIKWIKNLIY